MSDLWAAAAARIWQVPDDAGLLFTVDDTPIFDALYYRHFPLRWMLGADVHDGVDHCAGCQATHQAKEARRTNGDSA